MITEADVIASRAAVTAALDVLAAAKVRRNDAAFVAEDATKSHRRKAGPFGERDLPAAHPAQVAVRTADAAVLAAEREVSERKAQFGELATGNPPALRLVDLRAELRAANAFGSPVGDRRRVPELTTMLQAAQDAYDAMAAADTARTELELEHADRGAEMARELDRLHAALVDQCASTERSLLSLITRARSFDVQVRRAAHELAAAGLPWRPGNAAPGTGGGPLGVMLAGRKWATAEPGSVLAEAVRRVAAARLPSSHPLPRFLGSLAGRPALASTPPASDMERYWSGNHPFERPRETA